MSVIPMSVIRRVLQTVAELLRPAKRQVPVLVPVEARRRPAPVARPGRRT